MDMKLTRQYFDVREVRFGERCAFSEGVLTINEQELQSLTRDLFRAVKGFHLEITKPGEDARIIHVLDAPTQAMVGATAPVVGQALGAGKPELARKAAWTSTLWVAAIMFLPLAFLTWKGHWVATKLVPPDVADELGRFFLFMPLSTYFFGVLSVLTAAFIGFEYFSPKWKMWPTSMPRWISPTASACVLPCSAEIASAMRSIFSSRSCLKNCVVNSMSASLRQYRRWPPTRRYRRCVSVQQRAGAALKQHPPGSGLLIPLPLPPSRRPHYA